MKVIEVDEAQSDECAMWNAVLRDGVVQFARSGIIKAELIWTGNESDREWLMHELRVTIDCFHPIVICPGPRHHFDDVAAINFPGQIAQLRKV